MAPFVPRLRLRAAWFAFLNFAFCEVDGMMTTGRSTSRVRVRAIIPTPTPAQYRYQSTDFVALIHFNMGTYAVNGDPACGAGNWDVQAPCVGSSCPAGKTRDPATFAPKKLNTSQWMESITALGSTIAVLTAKHGCGFTIWPTKAKFSDGSAYGYNVQPEYGDVLRQFVASAKASGVGYGFYYSVMKNFYLCTGFAGENVCTDQILPGQRNLSVAEYAFVVRQQLQEIWGEYGNLTEVWTDSLRPKWATELMQRLQPGAMGTPHNPSLWCGTESGNPSAAMGDSDWWSTSSSAELARTTKSDSDDPSCGSLGNRACFHGTPNGDIWLPKFCDPQLFVDHVWFWEPGLAVRTLDELIPMYHDVVGNGLTMELAFAIDRDGLVQDSHANAYKQLGNWVRQCYGGKPLLTASGKGKTTSARGVTVYELGLLRSGITFDRFQLMEDTRFGQRVHNFTLSISPAADTHDTAQEQVLFAAQAIGIKRIIVLAHNFTTNQSTAVKLTVLASVAPPILKQVAVFAPCYGPRPPPRTPPAPPPGPISQLTCKTTARGSDNATLPCKEAFRGKICVDKGSLIGEGQSERSVEGCYKWCVATKTCTHFSYNSLVENGGHWCIRYAGCTPRPTNDSEYTTYKLCSVPWEQCSAQADINLGNSRDSFEIGIHRSGDDTLMPIEAVTRSDESGSNRTQETKRVRALKTTDGLATMVRAGSYSAAIVLGQLAPLCFGGTYLHASKSIDGPYTPVIPKGCNDSTGIWQRNNSIPFGAGVAGGYGGGPFLVDNETALATGLQQGNVVVLTTYNYQYPRGSNKTWPDATKHQFAAIGIAASWRDPLVLTDKVLYHFDHQNAGAGLCDGRCDSPACECIPKNGSSGWDGWSMEGGELYFSKKAQRWRAIFHSFRKDFTPADELPYGIHSGGYAESHTVDPLGAWTCYPPEVGAGYTKFVSAAGHEQVPRAPPPFTPINVPTVPFEYGKTNMSQPAYLNMSLDSWGGNVLKGPDDGLYHMMLDVMTNGQQGGLGAWESNSEVIHAVSERPEGPFKMKSVVLPTQNTNPHLLYDPTTSTYLLYTLSTGFGRCGADMPASRQCQIDGKCIGGRCQGCHKGHCGPAITPRAESRHVPTVDANGYVQLGRRERPKLLLDHVSGEPVWLYNGVQYGSGETQLVFTIATPMRPSNCTSAQVGKGFD